MASVNRILCISSDEGANRYLRERLMVEGGYSVSFVTNERDALESLHEGAYDVIVMKIEVGGMRENDSLKRIKKIDPDAVIVILSDDLHASELKEIFRQGVYDIITKPLSAERLLFSVRKGVDLHSMMVAGRKLSQSLQEENVSLQKQNTLLAKRIEESTKNLTRLYEDLRTTYMRTIKVLAQTIDARDHYTHSHSENVARYAVVIAEEMGLSVKEIETLREACELHDLGKIGIEDSILTKPAALDEQEWELMKRHPLMAAKILEPLTFLDGVVDLVKQHHEHYDGSGYPEGRRGEDIVLGARIIHLADAYDSMRSARSYRKIPLSQEEAVAEIRRKTGTQFDPKVVEAFLKVAGKLEEYS